MLRRRTIPRAYGLSPSLHGTSTFTVRAVVWSCFWQCGIIQLGSETQFESRVCMTAKAERWMKTMTSPTQPPGRTTALHSTVRHSPGLRHPAPAARGEPLKRGGAKMQEETAGWMTTPAYAPTKKNSIAAGSMRPTPSQKGRRGSMAGLTRER